MSERGTLSDRVGGPASPPAVEPYLFLAFDGNHPKLPTWRHRLGRIDEIVVGRGRKREVRRQRDGELERLTLRFPDPWMSMEHARILHGDKGWVMTDLGSKNGALVNGIRRESAVLTDGDLLQFGHTFFVYRDALPAQTGESLDVASDMDAPPGLLTVLTPLAQTFVSFARAAVSDVSLVIVGEKGAGKSVIAQSAHALSGRTGAFVTVQPGKADAARLDLRVRGAVHAGQVSEPGAIAEARGGTLVIEGIELLPARVQATLLEALRDGQIVPDGASEPIPVECRIIATSALGLDSLAARSSLDQELMARLSGFTLSLPPLRQRREDLGVLVASMLAHYAPDSDISFTAEATQALLCYPWPGNVRELESCIGTALALGEQGTVDIEHLPIELQRPYQTAMESGSDTLDTLELTEQDIKKRAEIIAALRARTGNLTASTDSLIKARSQFQSWLARRKINNGDRSDS